MDPAAKDNKYGKIGVTNEARKIVMTAPMGSTIPDRAPAKKALFLEFDKK